MHDVLSVILGGGRGARLYPLTKKRSEPAVPIAGKYRLSAVLASGAFGTVFKADHIFCRQLVRPVAVKKSHPTKGLVSFDSRRSNARVIGPG